MRALNVTLNETMSVMTKKPRSTRPVSHYPLHILAHIVEPIRHAQRLSQMLFGQAVSGLRSKAADPRHATRGLISGSRDDGDKVETKRTVA